MTNKDLFTNLFHPAYEKDRKEWQNYGNTLNNNIFWYPSAELDFMHFKYILQPPGIKYLSRFYRY